MMKYTQLQHRVTRKIEITKTKATQALQKGKRVPKKYKKEDGNVKKPLMYWLSHKKNNNNDHFKVNLS